MNRLSLLAAGMALSFGVAHAAAPNSAAFELTLVDMQGQKKMLGTLPGSVVAPRVSPDGTRVVFEMTEEGVPPPNTRPFVAPLDNLDQKRGLQPTLLITRNVAPVWSHDSDWVAFLSTGNGTDSIFWQRADGYIQPKYLVDGREPEGLYEGRLLAFLTLKGEKDYGISLLDMNTKKITRIDQAGSAQHSSQISRNGRWIAYTSDETGRAEIWVEPLPATGKRLQLTSQGGSHPQWSPDGSRLYYDQGGKIFRLELSVQADGLKTGEPVALPITGFQQGEIRRQYDLTPDGKSFVMLFPAVKK
jgi:Tol biopolymer transport system component